MNPEEKIKQLQITIPSAPKAVGLYKPVLVSQFYAYFSGHLPILENGTVITGHVGQDITIERGAEAARVVGLNILGSLRETLGSLDKVKSVIKLMGMVRSKPDFAEHAKVINGCSELFRDIWGDDRGVGVRSAFGVSGLPVNASVEIEGIFQLVE